jgi:sugar (pentulose or hexulose) kinase
MLAGVAGGAFSDFDEAVDRAVAIAPEQISPDPARAARYRESYDTYRRLYDGVEGALDA